jgi:hypothetical protein
MGETEVEGFLCDFQRTREHSAEELTGILPNKTLQRTGFESNQLLKDSVDVIRREVKCSTYIKVTDTWQSHVAMHLVK